MYPPINAVQLDDRLQAIRKTTIAFASLFKDIPFIKYDQNGVELEKIRVPIIYGDKEKYVKRLDVATEKVQITLPRIEYGLIDVNYDPSRRLNQATKFKGCNNNNAYVNAPVPYNFNFELVLYTRNIEDANQIMEYILPFFTPDYNLKISMVPELGIVKNIPISFTGDSQENDSSGSFDSPVRSVFRTFTFTARSYIFPPPKYYKPILTADTNIFIPQSTKKLILSSGNGTFLINELIYQGISLDKNTARANVLYWDENNKILYLENVHGNFTANSSIHNIDRTTNYSIDIANFQNLVFKTTSTPTPNTYPVTGPYTIDNNITDYTA